MSQANFRNRMWLSLLLAIAVELLLVIAVALFWPYIFTFLMLLEKKAGMSPIIMMMSLPLLIGGITLPPAALAAFAIWRRCHASGQTTWWAAYGFLAAWTATFALSGSGLIIVRILFHHGFSGGGFGHAITTFWPSIAILLIALLPIIAMFYVFSGDYERIIPSGKGLSSITGPGNIPSGRYYTYAVMTQAALSFLSIFGKLLFVALYSVVKLDILLLVGIYLSTVYSILSMLIVLITVVSGFLLGAAIRRQTPRDERPAATPPPSVHPAGGFGKQA